jgi:ubiquitin carboxyl-terminal hydrolase 22/27/51
VRPQRFEYKQGRNERAAKIETPVNFPLQLNMLPYTTRARGTEYKDNYELARSCTYDLLSVVEHKGEIDTGHYVTYSRVGDQVSSSHHPFIRSSLSCN